MASASALFLEKFGCEPDVVASAPGRVNLIGEHTDYNGGQVLPIAIAARTHVALRRSQKSESRVVSASAAGAGAFDALGPERSGEWWDYVAGVCASVNSTLEPMQFDAAVASDVPAGAGLSSSAALEVAIAAALNESSGGKLDATALALAAWRAENEFVGVSSGVMDQFASALCTAGHALHLHCDTLEKKSVAMRDTVLIFDTVKSRALRGSEFNTRRAECDKALRLLRERNPRLKHLADATEEEVISASLPAPLDRRALHVVRENCRVGAAVEALKRTGSIPGHILYESHDSLRDLYECSTVELDWFVDEMRSAPGVNGARLTGAGWGGCAIAVGDAGALEDVARELPAKYEARFGRAPRAWITAASAGARVDKATDSR